MFIGIFWIERYYGLHIEGLLYITSIHEALWHDFEMAGYRNDN